MCFVIYHQNPLRGLDTFQIRHIPREDNGRANAMAQEASGYAIGKKYFHTRKPIRVNAELQVLDEPIRHYWFDRPDQSDR
jgi:hypothetical protein